jgi:proline iminopeptidase
MIMKNILPFIFLLVITTTHAQYAHDSLKVDVGYIHYYTKGEGKPIVLLQGGPGYSSYYMRGISDSLTNFKTVLIDYQGHGRSQYKKPDSSWANIDNVIMDVELVRRHLGFNKWTLIGNSYGSHYALNYAIKYPEHTSKVILTASPGTNNKFLIYYGDNINLRRTEEDVAALKKFSSPKLMETVERMQITFKAYFFDQTKTKVVFNPPKEEIPFFYNFEYYKAAVTRPGFEDWDISDEVYALDLPIRIIQGRQDPVNGMEVQLNERAKNSKLIYIERAGHFPWAEEPLEFFAVLRRCIDD